MIKVCHLSSAHTPGSNRIFHKECVSLAEAGYNVSYVVPGESCEKDGVHIVGVEKAPGGRFRRMIQTARRVYQAALAVDADIYHFHDPELLPYGLKLKRRGKKVIFDSHEMYTEQIRRKHYLSPWAARAAAKAYGAYERRVLRQIDGLIFPCLKDGKHPFEGMCRHVADVNNTPRLRELYDRYDPDLPKWERSACYVGGLTRDRGITNLVLASEKADCTVYLGGTFPSASYQAEIEALPEYAHVRHLGQLTRAQVAETLQRCQVGLCTVLTVGEYNRYDNLLTKVYEYMALGLPVVLTRAPFNEKMMRQYQFGICVDPENPDEIAAAVRYLLDNPEEARRMGENGRRAVKEEFNWGVDAAKLLALYEDILKE